MMHYFATILSCQVGDLLTFIAEDTVCRCPHMPGQELFAKCPRPLQSVYLLVCFGGNTRSGRVPGKSERAFGLGDR